jgi:hypothetical protein
VAGRRQRKWFVGKLDTVEVLETSESTVQNSTAEIDREKRDTVVNLPNDNVVPILCSFLTFQLK